MRIDQILTHYGYCSRKEAKQWVKAGRICIAQKIIDHVDFKAHPADILVDNQKIDFPYGMLVILHKPEQVVCSHNSEEGKRIYDLLPIQWQRRKPTLTSIGRLDKDTTGLILLTDQTYLVQQWTSPKHKIAKVYEVTVDKALDEHLIALFAKGDLMLKGEKTPCLSAKLDILTPWLCHLTLWEGRYHQVKRMFTSQGYHVIKLHRIQFGDYSLDQLLPGEFYTLSLEKK